MFSKKTYRDTRWMDRVMSVTVHKSANQVGEETDWRKAGSKYTILAHSQFDGWVEVYFIRRAARPISDEDMLQCHTNVGIIQLLPVDRDRIHVELSS